MLVASRVDVGVLRWRTGSIFQPSLALLLVAALLLAAVWAPDIGHASHGRHRWLNLGPISLQPSEIAKIATMVFLAAILSRNRLVTREHPLTAHAVIATLGILCVMIGLEDFGTAALLAAVGGLMLLAGGIRLSAMAAWAVPAIGAFAFLLCSQPYRIERLLSFRRVWDDPQGTGYHAIQSLGTIASGGWSGRGLGSGVAQFGYLPEARTDFVFAVICEEMGLGGGAMVILLFVTLVILGWRALRTAPTDDGGFRSLYVFGITLLIGLQALMNIAVVTVMAPTKGIALPFVSAGGSSVLCFGGAIGLAAGVARRSVASSTDRADPLEPLSPTWGGLEGG
jgi:cell division protein FtsW